MKKIFITLFILGSMFFLKGKALAHEAYVLPANIFWQEVSSHPDHSVWQALKNPQNLKTTLIIVVSVFILLSLNFLFRLSKAGKNFHNFIEKFSFLGPHFVRYSLAIAFFLSAFGNVFLGPELLGIKFSQPHAVQVILFVISVMVAIGFLTELAALVGIGIFIISFFVFGPYIFTYLNYFGELMVLLLFGMRTFSFDRYLFGPLKRFKDPGKYEYLILRIFYGLSLIYAAIVVKLMHPSLTVEVVNRFNLTQFHFLFPADPLLVTLGAGVVEIVIGLFIILGFEIRLTVLISLFYITLSLFYFKELVWPHLILYGISLYLLVQPENFTLDSLLLKKNKKRDLS